MFFVKNRKIFFVITVLLIVFSIGSMFVRGLNFGIDFTGGSILEVTYQETRPELSEVRERLDQLSLGEYSLRPSGSASYVLRTGEITHEIKDQAIKALSVDSQYVLHEDRFNTIGPVVGAELKNKALISIIIAVLCILIFITFAFRKVSKPVSSWKYGIVTVITLVHDVVVPAGIFIALSFYTGAVIDVLFVAALLAILGFSVHDTIVVFDRIRENLRVNDENNVKEPFENVVGRSLNQTIVRSINTSVTIIFVLATLYLFGGEAIRNFSLLMVIGVIAGTYSSIVLASPILVELEKFSRKSNSR